MLLTGFGLILAWQKKLLSSRSGARQARADYTAPSDDIAEEGWGGLVQLSEVRSARLGFEPEEIGTYSLCLGATLEMFLAGATSLHNHAHWQMLQRRFLALHLRQVKQFLKDVAQKIQWQVKQCSKDVAQKILMHWLFQTIPDVALCEVSNEDPPASQPSRQRQEEEKYWTRHVLLMQLPAFSLFNWPHDNDDA
jgi:hypothetical protein